MKEIITEWKVEKFEDSPEGKLNELLKTFNEDEQKQLIDAIQTCIENNLSKEELEVLKNIRFKKRKT